MKPSAIVMKTFPIMLIRLAVYLAFFLVACIYAAIVIGLAGLLKPDGLGLFLFLAVFGGGGWGIYRLVREYINYMIKAAHVAIIAELAVNGSVPEGFGMYAWGVERVKKQFVASNVLFGLDRLVAGSVRQIQRTLGSIASFLSFIPGLKSLTDILNLFVDIILNYVDECILAMIFLKRDENVWKTAADSIVLYVENWKTVLKTGGKLLLFIVAFMVVGFLLFLGLFQGLFAGAGAASGAGSIIAIVITIVFALVLKWAIVDSVVMVYMVSNYLQVAYGQQPSYDLYSKVEGMSKKFGEIMGKARESMAPGSNAGPAAGTGPV